MGKSDNGFTIKFTPGDSGSLGTAERLGYASSSDAVPDYIKEDEAEYRRYMRERLGLSEDKQVCADAEESSKNDK